MAFSPPPSLPLRQSPPPFAPPPGGFFGKGFLKFFFYCSPITGIPWGPKNRYLRKEKKFLKWGVFFPLPSPSFTPSELWVGVFPPPWQDFVVPGRKKIEPWWKKRIQPRNKNTMGFFFFLKIFKMGKPPLKCFPGPFFLFPDLVGFPPPLPRGHRPFTLFRGKTNVCVFGDQLLDLAPPPPPPPLIAPFAPLSVPLFLKLFIRKRIGSPLIY